MKKELEGFVPLTGYISDQFINGYTGNFSERLWVHQPRLEKFLSLASLNGRVLLVDKTASRHRAVGGELNMDGSLSSWRRLRWGDKIDTLNGSDKRTVSTKADKAGWVISIDGDGIRERIMAKSNQDVRAAGNDFGRSFNRSLHQGFSRVLVADKLTGAKDGFVLGRYVGTLVYSKIIQELISQHDLGVISTFSVLALSTTILNLGSRYHTQRTGERDSFLGTDPSIDWFFKYLCPVRRDLTRQAEVFDTPIAVDRLAIAGCYLQSQKLLRHPLVKI